MSKTSATLPVGSLIILHKGEYSDKTASGPFKALKPFNGDDLLAEFKAQWSPKNDWDEAPDPEEFEAWVVKVGCLEAVENVTHWHIGSYGEIDPGEPWFGEMEAGK
jgi:hypothetical protein